MSGFKDSFKSHKVAIVLYLFSFVLPLGTKELYPSAYFVFYELFVNYYSFESLIKDVIIFHFPNLCFFLCVFPKSKYYKLRLVFIIPGVLWGWLMVSFTYLIILAEAGVVAAATCISPFIWISAITLGAFKFLK